MPWAWTAKTGCSAATLERYTTVNTERTARKAYFPMTEKARCILPELKSVKIQPKPAAR